MTYLKFAGALAALTLIVSPAIAQDKIQNDAADETAATLAATEVEIVTAKVNGLVCDFCAQSLRKVFKRQDAVEDIKVDLDTGEVKVTLKPGTELDDETVGQLIRKSGYSLVGIERTGGA